jgi:hypothetical protein
MTLSFLIIHVIIGYHNFKRVGIFYTVSTQAKDGFYDYLVPLIISKKNEITTNEAKKYLNNQKMIWMKKNNLDENLFTDETKKMKYYDYAKDYSIKIMLKNPVITGKIIFKKTLHFFIIDPLTHVYFFHRWSNEEGLFYGSENQKKWLIPRIIYSFIIYFFVFFGLLKFFIHEKNNRLFILSILSIIYFTAVQSWYGGTRYFAPIIIYLSFFFSYGLINFKDLIKTFKFKND